MLSKEDIEQRRVMKSPGRRWLGPCCPKEPPLVVLSGRPPIVHRNLKEDGERPLVALLSRRRLDPCYLAEDGERPLMVLLSRRRLDPCNLTEKNWTSPSDAVAAAGDSTSANGNDKPNYQDLMPGYYQ